MADGETDYRQAGVDNLMIKLLSPDIALYEQED